MLKGFLNHGCVIVNDLLLGTRTRVHTVSFPARRAPFTSFCRAHDEMTYKIPLYSRLYALPKGIIVIIHHFFDVIMTG